MSSLQKYLVEFFAKPNAPTQREIADKARVSRVFLNKIVRGHSSPSIPIAERIADATGKKLSAILKKYETVA